MLHRSLRFVAVALLAATLLASGADAGQARLVRGHTHDGGFFLRLSGGLGGAGTSADAPGGDLELSGTSGDINIAIGGIVSPGLALHGTLWGWVVEDPDVEWGDLEGWLPTDLDMSAIGGGATYYFMPANLYISGSLGFGTLSLGRAESDAGLAMDFTVGKEWWVGARWGLGVAGSLGYHNIPDEGDIDWTGQSVAVRFTATFN